MTGMRSLLVLALFGAQSVFAAENEGPRITSELRQRAEDLAGAASQRFTDILDGKKRQEIAQSGSPQPAGHECPGPGSPCPSRPAAQTGGPPV